MYAERVRHSPKTIGATVSAYLSSCWGLGFRVQGFVLFPLKLVVSRLKRILVEPKTRKCFDLNTIRTWFGMVYITPE